MIVFNDSSILVGEIKELLASRWLPTCKVLPYGKEAVEMNWPDGTAFVGRGFLSRLKEGKAVRIDSYKPWDFIPNLSKKLEIRNNYYDSYTHAYLGDYLRFVRDAFGLNLMGMYNCFTWDMPKYVQSLDAVKGKFSSDDPSYDLFMFPVKPGKAYTFAIDWHGSIEMCACIYDNNVLSDDSPKIAEDTYARFSGLRFSKPVLYTGVVGLNPSIPSERLKVFVKIPSECSSSVVVLEGDWRDCSEKYVDGISQRKSTFTHAIANGGAEAPVVYSSSNQLLSTNDGERNQLADRLVEYLVGNVVGPMDAVSNDIRKLQSKLLAEGRTKTAGQPGIWNDGLRKALWDFTLNSGLLDEVYDLFGYMDKDVESRFGGLKIFGGEED